MIIIMDIFWILKLNTLKFAITKKKKTRTLFEKKLELNGLNQHYFNSTLHFQSYCSINWIMRRQETWVKKNIKFKL